MKFVPIHVDEIRFNHSSLAKKVFVASLTNGFTRRIINKSLLAARNFIFRQLVLVVVLLHLIPFVSPAGVIERAYYFSSPSVLSSGDYVKIEFPGTSQFGEPGRPVLPFQPVRLLLPPGEAADSIAIYYEDPVTLAGTYLVQPGQNYRPLSYMGRPEFLFDMETYSSGMPYPNHLKSPINTAYMHGYGIALSAFTPVSYIPEVGQLSYFRKVTVVVYSSADRQAGESQANFRNMERDAEMIASLAQNPELLSFYERDANPLRSGQYRYLLITSATYAPELDTLVSFYTQRGFPARCYTLTYIDTAATGNDMQEKIRDFIRQEYLQRGVDYVLLGGDVQIVGYRGFYCSVVSGGDTIVNTNLPADLYYSALDGTWNTDNDNRWGEAGEDDLLPEVAVGRLTFSSTDELQKMIHKVTSYQQNPVIADLERPFLAGEHLYSSPLTYGGDYLNLLVGHQTYNGYVTDGIHITNDIDSLYDEYGTWSKQRLMDSINSGRSYIHHVGHANTTYAMRLSNSDITNANFSQVDGIIHQYPIVYTHGCICGNFTASDCIAEKMIGIDNFAAAFIGNSHYGWFVEGTADGPSQHLHREFVDALYSDSLYRIGMAHMRSKAEMAPFLDLPEEYEPGAHRYCFYDCNVLGDPAMALWTATPHQLTAEYPHMISTGAESMTVMLGCDGLPQKAVVCGLFQDGNLLGYGESTSGGQCVLTLYDPPQEGEATLVVSGMNVQRFTIPVIVADFWKGLTTQWNDPENWNSLQVPDSTTNIIIPAVPEGGNSPEFSPGEVNHCNSLFIEPNASLHLDENDTLIIHGN